MPNNLVFSVRFLQPYSHGRGDGGDPEWPPSPLRFLQALVAASAAHWNERSQLEYARPAIQWLESLPQPEIVASRAVASDVPTQFYVPDNTAELLVPQWKKGNVNEVPKRTEKVVCPTRLLDDAVHYLYALPDGVCPHLELLRDAARSITHLGWGVDMVAADADMISEEVASKLPGHSWRVDPSVGEPLRVPRTGTLDDLIRKHTDFLNRVTDDGFRPVPPLREFDVVRYRSQHEAMRRPYRLLELRNLDGSRFRYSHRRLIHIAGMVRHLAIEAMKLAPPPSTPDDWTERYVAGHADKDQTLHRQFSYLPLPSIGHEHTDPGVRRVMIVAPLGDEAWLDHLARRLSGQMLKPLLGNEFAGREPPLLVPLRSDNVVRRYVEPQAVWHSFTPVILPGHDDHKPGKTCKLIEKALAQSGVEQPCDFEWSAFSRFSKSYSAHKYDKHQRPQGYIRPGHLLNQTAIHLTLRFHDGTAEKQPVKVPGPLAIGAGRHCGFGLMAGDSG